MAPTAITLTVAQQIIDKVRGLFDLGSQLCSAEGESIAGDVGPVATRIPLKQGNRRVADLLFAEKLDPSQLEVIRSLAELIIQESLTLDDSPYRDEKVDKFIFDLITLSQAGDRELRSRSKLLGIDLKVPRLAMVAVLEGIDQERGEDREFVIERTKRGLARCLSSFYTRSPENEVAYLGGKVFLILKDISGKDSPAQNAAAFKGTLETIHQIFRGDFGGAISVGVGNYHPGLTGLRTSFKEAKTAVDLGRQMMGGGQIYHIEDFGVVAGVLSGFEGMPKREGDLVSTLRADHDMARTLATFFDANLSLTETAERLGIHRNTLVYRLEKITTTLGLDPRRFDEAVQIKLALLMQRFEEDL